VGSTTIGWDTHGNHGLIAMFKHLKKEMKRYGIVGWLLILGIFLMISFVVVLGITGNTATVRAVENENSFMNQIVAGDWWGAISSVYVNVIGSTFWVIMIVLPCAMLYIKTRNSGPPTLLLIIGSAVFGFLFPMPARFLFVTFIGIGVGLILYGAFTKKGGY